MSMRKAMQNVYRTFINDETLLRLLYYPPKNIGKNIPDPLSEVNVNVLDMPVDEKWSIIDERIVQTPTVDDLGDKALCRLLFYAGRRKPTSNYYVANQELICDILCHFNYEKDQRSTWIADRINDLLVRENIESTLGKVDFIDGQPIGSPEGYTGYRLIYKFGSNKK